MHRDRIRQVIIWVTARIIRGLPWNFCYPELCYPPASINRKMWTRLFTNMSNFQIGYVKLDKIFVIAERSISTSTQPIDLKPVRQQRFSANKLYRLESCKISWQRCEFWLPSWSREIVQQCNQGSIRNNYTKYGITKNWLKPSRSVEFFVSVWSCHGERCLLILFFSFEALTWPQTHTDPTVVAVSEWVRLLFNLLTSTRGVVL